MSLEPQRDAPDTAPIPGGDPVVLRRHADEDGEEFSRRVAHARAVGAERLKAQADKHHVVNWRSHMAACFGVPLGDRPSVVATRRLIGGTVWRDGKQIGEIEF